MERAGGTKAMLLGLQLTLLGFIIIALEIWIMSANIGGTLIVAGTLLGFAGFASGRGQ